MSELIYNWFDRRLGLASLSKTLLDEPIPGGPSFVYVFGSAMLFLFTLQIVTGFSLMFFYTPGVDTAWESTRYILEEVNYGWLVLSLHAWGGSAMIMVVFLHILQVFIWGAYKKPRELVWVMGIILIIILNVMVFSGYLLPWDQRSYFAMGIALELLDKAPIIGDALARFLKGGATRGVLSLSRFFTLHAMLLPAVLAIGAGIHLFLMRRAGPAGSIKAAGKVSEEESETFFYPGQVTKDMIFAGILLVILIIGASLYPAEVVEKASAEASDYNPRPEWYFIWLFQLLRLPFFTGEIGEFIGGIVVPGLLLGFLILVPFIDRNPERHPKRRLVAMSIMALFVMGFITLTVMGLLGVGE